MVFEFNGESNDLVISGKSTCAVTAALTDAVSLFSKVGSILGPLLFSIYVNDLPIQTKFQVNLFAYDTVLILKDRNITKLQELVNKALKIVDEWMKYNRLSLNYNKTIYFVVYPKRKKTMQTTFL